MVILVRIFDIADRCHFINHIFGTAILFSQFRAPYIIPDGSENMSLPAGSVVNLHLPLIMEGHMTILAGHLKDSI